MIEACVFSVVFLSCDQIAALESHCHNLMQARPMSGGNSKGDSVWKAGDVLMSQKGFPKEDPCITGLTTILQQPSKTLVWNSLEQVSVV